MSSPNRSPRRKVVWFVVVVLGILHYDFWAWDDQSLLFGFLPVTLGYHAGFSIVAGLTWALAVAWAWPAELEEWASEDVPGGEA